MNPYQSPTADCRTSINPDKWIDRRIIAGTLISLAMAILAAYGCGFIVEQLLISDRVATGVIVYSLSLLFWSVALSWLLLLYCDHLLRNASQ